MEKNKGKNEFEIGILLEELRGNILKAIAEEYKS